MGDRKGRMGLLWSRPQIGWEFLMTYCSSAYLCSRKQPGFFFFNFGLKRHNQENTTRNALKWFKRWSEWEFYQLCALKVGQKERGSRKVFFYPNCRILLPFNQILQQMKRKGWTFMFFLRGKVEGLRSSQHFPGFAFLQPLVGFLREQFGIGRVEWTVPINYSFVFFPDVAPRLMAFWKMRVACLHSTGFLEETCSMSLLPFSLNGLVLCGYF